MTLEYMRNILFECDLVEDIHMLDDTLFRGMDYEGVFEGKLIVDALNYIKIVLAIPKTWKLDLIDIYVVNFEEITFIPHIDNKGKMCLFEKEGILIDWDLGGIIRQSLFRAQSILKEGFAGENRMDFIKEFELYWCQLSETRLAYFTVPMEEDNCKIKFTFENVKKKKNEKNIEYKNRSNSSRLYIGRDADSLKRWNLEKATLMNAAYFFLNAEDYIFPPDIRNSISVDYLNDLMKMLPYGQVKKAISKLKRNKVIIFAIKQPMGDINYIGFYCIGGDLQEYSGSYLINNVDKIQPLVISRNDKDYLLKRTLEINPKIANKKMLIVGCGSIGGYLVCELAKAGYEDITLVDDDLLGEENIFRHALGMEYVSQYKCVALANYIRKNIPEVSLKTLSEKFENVVLEGDIELDNYDIIVSATGNQNLNRWINAFVMENQIEVPVVYAWNEVYGIGNHVAYFKHGNEACYECIFGRDEITGEIYNKSSYCALGQNVTKTLGGCGKTYIPYGNTISMKTVILCLEVIKAAFENSLEDNLLISIKGSASYFIKQGLVLSGRYKAQKEDVKVLTGNKFVNKKCNVCNGNNRK